MCNACETMSCGSKVFKRFRFWDAVDFGCVFMFFQEESMWILSWFGLECFSDYIFKNLKLAGPAAMVSLTNISNRPCSDSLFM